MKTRLAVIVCMAICLMQGAAMGAALYDAVWTAPPTGVFFYSIWWNNAYDDWTKVGSADYEDYLKLSPTSNMSLKISTNAPAQGTIEIPGGTWAGFQWSVPSISTQVSLNTTVNTAGWKINKWQVNGWCAMPTQENMAEVYLVDGTWDGLSDPAATGHVLWSQATMGFLPNTLDTLTNPSANLRFIVYVPQDVTLFDTNYVEAGTSSIMLYSVTPEPATLIMLGLGGMLLRRKK